MENFNKFGVMVDCSRNAVMTVEQLKKFITVISKMGYNQVHLYMEDTYEVNDEAYFGYLRGKYSKEELKELDDFAYGIGVARPKLRTNADATSTKRPLNTALASIGYSLDVAQTKSQPSLSHQFCKTSRKV